MKDGLGFVNEQVIPHRGSITRRAWYQSHRDAGCVALWWRHRWATPRCTHAINPSPRAARIRIKAAAPLNAASYGLRHVQTRGVGRGWSAWSRHSSRTSPLTAVASNRRPAVNDPLGAMLRLRLAVVARLPRAALARTRLLCFCPLRPSLRARQRCERTVWRTIPQVGPHTQARARELQTS
jgi:hypothetical protein